jgi:predicted anti-sigma-YlaC factor YlaD
LDAVWCDYLYVTCELYREALSARLDGEDEPVEAADTDQHLQRCPACREWFQAAAAVTRLVRVQPLEELPRLDPVALLPAAGVGRATAGSRWVGLTKVLRLLLGGLGVAQFVLGMTQAASNAAVEHYRDAATAAGATPSHLWHESAAWNVAVGAGFAWIALRRGRPAGVLPMLTAFVALLVMLSASDVLAGRVDQIRLLSHGFLLAGYLIVLGLCHPRLDSGTPPSGWLKPPGPWRGNLSARVDEPGEPEPTAGRPPLRLIPGQAQAASPDRIAA